MPRKEKEMSNPLGAGVTREAAIKRMDKNIASGEEIMQAATYLAAEMAELAKVEPQRLARCPALLEQERAVALGAYNDFMRLRDRWNTAVEADFKALLAEEQGIEAALQISHLGMEEIKKLLRRS